jgi:MFS family permease
VSLVVGQIACSSLPSDRGARPGAVATGSGGPVSVRDHDIGSAMRTAAFWLLIVGHGTALAAVSAVSLHLVPLMTHHHGASLATAGLTVAMMSTAQLLGQVVTGVIGDRIDKRVLAAVCMVVQTGVLVALATVPGAGLAMAVAVVHGVSWGLRGPIMTALRSDYFGVRSFGAIMGWSMGFVSIGLVVGPLLVTALVDGVNGYPTAFLALAAITATGAIAFTVMRRPRRPAPLSPQRPRCDEAAA